MKLKVVLGDWSNDGHGMTETFIVELATVHDDAEHEEMYRLGVKVVGFDMKKEVARNYEDNRIEVDRYERLVELGYVPYSFKKNKGMWDELPSYDTYGNHEGYWINTELYLDMYMFFVALGYKEMIGNNDSFGYYIASDGMPQATIGGYGLFYN